MGPLFKTDLRRMTKIILLKSVLKKDRKARYLEN